MVFLTKECLACLQPINIFSRLHICHSCYKHLPFYKLTPFDRNFYIFYYKPPISSFIHKFKYSGNMIYGKLLADLIVSKLNCNPHILKEIKNSVLIPIPIHPTKVKKRGFDHCSFILNKVALKLGLDTNYNYLYSNRNISSQASHNNPESRISNVDGVFSVNNRQRLKKSKIIIFDDILTTGATVNEAQKTILSKNESISLAHFCICFNKGDL